MTEEAYGRMDGWVYRESPNEDWNPLMKPHIKKAIDDLQALILDYRMDTDIIQTYVLPDAESELAERIADIESRHALRVKAQAAIHAIYLELE